jgi:hypothetical protein
VSEDLRSWDDFYFIFFFGAAIYTSWFYLVISEKKYDLDIYETSSGTTNCMLRRLLVMH